jgi:secretory phospholipase A2
MSVVAVRKRRDVLLLVRVPGTQWCGVGSRASHDNDLGGFMSADRCCRIHDTECPYHIATLTEKYGLYNWRAYTLNHCDCDER